MIAFHIATTYSGLVSSFHPGIPPLLECLFFSCIWYLVVYILLVKIG